MSRRYRLGNDLEIHWTVNIHKDDGTVLDLTSLDLGVQLCVGSKVFEIDEPTITANLITFLYPGSSQIYDGPYIIKLYDKTDSSITYDVRNAFILYDNSWTASHSDNVVELETDIDSRQIIVVAGEKGEKGDKGDKGDPGASGTPGQDGRNGNDGVDGRDGQDGRDGADGHDGADGRDGIDGKSIRTTVFGEGIMYYDGSSVSPDGIYYLDIVSDKAVVDLSDTLDNDVHFYVCKVTHQSTQGEDLTDTTLWTPMSNLGPIVSPLILTEKLKAKFIDVDDLHVKHLDGADGSFSGEVSASSGSIEGTLEIGENGKFITSGNLGIGNFNSRVEIDNNHIYQKTYTQNGFHETELHNGVGTWVTVTGAGSHTPVRSTTKVSSAGITNSIYRSATDTTETTYAVFCDGEYKFAIASALPQDILSNTIYIITSGNDKGLYVGSVKIC